ncbi:protein ALP1-like isoform X2 [Humulus lupulus]|uniref:protein ALP1-like isoform X2 n=1 Tax=Humulus lupulus TaxID=3486 RepID=UPI002B40B750|nr:protein ALP1-like isoform X2 [Humulus lupulus]
MAAGSGASNSNRRKAKKMKSISQNENDKRFTQEEILTLVNNAAAAAHSFLSQNDILLLPSQTLALESLISSALLSLRRFNLQPLSLHSAPHNPPEPGQCWFGRFLSIAGAGEHSVLWFHAFRMSEPSFTLLLRLLTPDLNAAAVHSSVPANFVLAAALYRLAHGAGYKALARRFGLGSSEKACRAFFTVCKAINEKLGHFFELQSDLGRILGEFGWLSLPNCCGVLGVGKFGVDGGKVLGENGSLYVQALVDSAGRFLDVSAGWPSTLKPEVILHQTKLYIGVEETRELLNGPCLELSNGGSVPQYVLGDSCFPLLPWLLTPYTKSKKEGEEEEEEDGLTSMEKGFNSAHLRAMRLVRMAFGKVRNRWQLLSKQWKEECLEFLPFVVVTCCLLHNFLIKTREITVEDEEEDIGNSKEEEDEEEEEKLPVFNGEMNESGQKIRDAVAMNLSRVCLKR